MKKKKWADVSCLILGGGLAGISTAYHLRNKSHLLIEREHELGGTARSFKIGAFTFDFTGHLLHLHNPYTKKLITQLLKGNFYRCTRKAWIFSHNTYTRYPFQANTYGLPDRVINDCVLGFYDAYQDNQKNKKDFAKMNFKEWCLQIFGSGISEHFMLPYNEKLYQTSAQNMTVDWCGAFVPKVELSEVIRGAMQDQQKGFGYNTQFLYPKHGGIQELAKSLGKGLKTVKLNTTIRNLDWRRKTATLSDGQIVQYESLVNTIPLLELMKLMNPLPASIENAKKKLKCVGILCLNLGVNRAKISDKSWIYFPEKKYPFYRVGFPMNFTPHVVPRGCSSMYVEVPFNLSNRRSKAQILKDVRKGLIDAQILKPSDKFLAAQFLPIRYAYVIYDHQRTAATQKIFSFLADNSIQSIGRYGAWKYSFMEEAILDGKKAAEKVLGQKN